MRYLGGKARLAKHIVQFLESVRKGDQCYVEPFLGGCNILPLMSGERIGGEAKEDLILFYKALRDGWKPPTEVSEALYKELKTAPPSPLRGFVGIACSFAGIWFGTYARSADNRNYALNGYNTAMKTAPKLAGTTLITSDYRYLKIPVGSLVYCDPPYANTTKYTEAFDHDEFWLWADQLSNTCDVYVSEYTAPEGWEVVWEKERNLEIRRNKKASEKRTERIFTKST